MTETDQPSLDETRHIHDTLGGDQEFLRGLTAKDIMLMFGPFVILLFPLGLPFTPSTLTIPIFGLAIATLPLMGLLYKTTPAHLTLSESLQSKISWLIKKKTYRLGTRSLDESLYTTQIDEVRENSIHRTDGAVVGAVKINPANMALENQDSWTQAVSSFANYANSTFEFKTQLYITGREIHADDHTTHLKDRLDDKDVRDRPVLQQLTERFINWYTGRLDTQGAHTREYYIIVPVTDNDIKTPDEADTSVIDVLSDAPFIGNLFNRVQTRQTDMTDAQQERLKQQKLDSRLDEVRRGANNLYGCRGTVVDSYYFAQILKEYWSCGTEDYGDIKQALGTLPITASKTDTGEATAHGLKPRAAEADGIEETVDSELEDFVDPDDTSAAAEEKREVVRTAEAHKALQDIEEKHKSFFAPSTIDWERNHGVIDGDTYVRTYWVENFPEYPSDGFLERVLLEANLGTDISIHLDPFETQSALDALSDWISSLQVTYEELRDSGEIRADDLEADIERAKSIRSAVRSNETSLFRGGIYLRVTAESEKELRQRSRELESLLKDVPANCTPKVATRWQEKGLVTTSPIGRNELGDNRMSTMTGSAVGAMFPFSSNYYMDDEGIEYGIHGHNGSPVLIDPFELDTGFNELVVGDIGSGKTFDVKKNIIRTVQNREDVKVVMLDPVQGFRGLIDAFGGNSVVVGGQTRINPLHIEKTPKKVLENADGDLDPFAAKKDEVMSFLDNFFAMEGIELGDRRGVLRYAINEVYSEAGINSTVNTHARDSPTMQDLIGVIVDIAEDPGAHEIVSSESGHDAVVDAANALEMALQPFKDGGTYENLAQESNVDILSSNNDDRMVYIDLQQEDGRGESNKSFMMQLLLSTVYQQAKKTDKKVLFAIDEAHYLLKNQENLDYIQQIIRHSRHVDMRMVLASQTLEEFYTNEETRTIANQCSIKVFHKLSGLSQELADELELSEEQMDFVKHAAAGDEDLGYSEALVQIKEEGEYPLQVQVHDLELELIEHGMDGKKLLGAIAGEEEDKQAFREFLETEGAIRTLFEYYDLPQEKARTLVENGVTYNQLVDSLINLVDDLPEDQAQLIDWVDEDETADNQEGQEASEDDGHWSDSEYWAGREKDSQQ